MSLKADDHPAWTFENPADGTRLYVLNENDLAIYDAENDKAWLACEDAPHLRDYV